MTVFEYQDFTFRSGTPEATLKRFGKQVHSRAGEDVKYRSVFNEVIYPVVVWGLYPDGKIPEGQLHHVEAVARDVRTYIRAILGPKMGWGTLTAQGFNRVFLQEHEYDLTRARFFRGQARMRVAANEGRLARGTYNDQDSADTSRMLRMWDGILAQAEGTLEVEEDIRRRAKAVGADSEPVG